MYIFAIKKYLEFIGGAEPTRDNVELYIDYLLKRKTKPGLEEESKRRTASWHLAVIKRYFKLMGRHEELEEVEAPSFVERDRDYVTKTDIQRIMNACKTNGERAIIGLLYGGALRNGEVIQLTPASITDTGVDVPTEKKRQRTKSYDFVPLDKMVIGWVRAYIAEYDKPPEKLFPVSTETIRDIVTRVTNRAGGVVTVTHHLHVTPHTFRHSRITHMAQDGVNLYKIKEFARHRDIRTTMKYVHIRADTDLGDIPMPEWV